MVGLLSALSQSLLGVRLSAGQLLRALAYSQGANMLSFVPGVGRLLSLWTIVSGVAAVREISGADTQKVADFHDCGRGGGRGGGDGDRSDCVWDAVRFFEVRR